MKHFERYGLDTITYLQGPDGDMLSIITDHAKFTLEAAEKAEKDQMEFEYDSYDKANVLDAIEYVTSSLDDHLEEQIHQVYPRRWIHYLLDETNVNCQIHFHRLLRVHQEQNPQSSNLR